MKPELADSYRCAEAVARSRARNFYYSFVVLPPEKRRALCAVYAFMRHCDDISDGSDSLEGKRARLKAWRDQIDPVAGGDADGSPFLPAFRDSVQKFSIPPGYFHWIIDGAEMDLTVNHYRTFEDLHRYCFLVASAVGLVCLQIFGYRTGRAKELAEHCGIAFQLTNILRDVREDASMGRIYIPEEDLERFEYTAEDLRSGVVDSRFIRLMTFEANRAQQYYHQAQGLLPLVDPASRPALWAMMEIYESLLKKLCRRRFDVFRSRISLSSTAKTAIAVRALSMRYLRI